MAIQGNKKILLKENVLEATYKRMRWIFDEFPNVIVSFSGGKDSTVLWNIAYNVAKEKGRLPLNTMWLDQESELYATFEYVEKIMSHPDVNPMWYQSEFPMNTSTSHQNAWFQVWDHKVPEKWVRPKHSLSREDTGEFRETRFSDMFLKVLKKEMGDKKTAYVAGVRCEESPMRLNGLTQANTYRGAAWGKRMDTKCEQYTLYPIYDWFYTDIWKAIYDHDWEYNKGYDMMYQYGLPINLMRISALHHETSVSSLFYLQEFESENYNRVCNRIGGTQNVNKMQAEDFRCPKRLPFMFTDWVEYRDYLVETIIEDEHKERFKKKFKDMEEPFYWAFGDGLYKRQITSILCNDFEFVKLNLTIPTQKLTENTRRRNERKQQKATKQA